MDVKIVFLYGDVKEEVYIKLSLYFKQLGKICCLNKVLYGFKQVLYIWFQILIDFLDFIRYKLLVAKPSIFTNGMIFISIYIDNLFIIGSNITNIKTLKTALSKRFKITDLKPYKYYLGIKIICNYLMCILYLYQGVYIDKILTKEDFTIAYNQQSNLPMIKNILTLYINIVIKAKRKFYISNIGFIIYLILFIQPDIAFIILIVFCFSSNPTPVQIQSVKKLLQYIYFIRNLAFQYYGNFRKLTGYYNVNYTINKSRRSTLGYCFNISSNIISQ